MQCGIEDILREKAKQKFGEARAEELKPDLDKLAAEIDAIRTYPMSIEDEL